MGYSEKQFRFDGGDGASIAGFRWADESVTRAPCFRSLTAWASTPDAIPIR
uniref:Uncharacterized protein n=1 Tax=Phenylobacterium glaciei TaxID=2803784 RepID=A0A974S6W2_9CAUL|nr:hypothetical protein JKL49_15005 [Phenylobacterium glaciei]